MGLETPLALLGLLGVLIPLLAHRLRRRELPRVVLPTFALLARASAKSQRKRAFSDLVLLCVRIGIVVLASIALAAPYFSSIVSFGDGKIANVAIIIDDSLSMARQQDGEALIEQARARALEALSALPRGSEVSLVLSGKPARVLLPLSRDLSAARRTLERATLRAVRPGDLTAALQTALRQQSRGEGAQRRVLVLSDFARNDKLELRGMPLDSVALSAERLGEPARSANLYIAQLHAVEDPSREGEFSIAVEVRSAPGPQPPASVRVVAEVRDKTAAEAEIALDHGQGKGVLHVKPQGARQARVRLVAQDALQADNQRAVLLGRLDAVRLLLVNGDPRPSSREDELYYVTRALSLVPEAQLALHLQSVDPLSLEHATLDDYDVIVLANAPAPSAQLSQRLTQFVRKGGGLIIAAGRRVEPAQYNAALSSLLPSHIRGLAPAQPLHFKAASVQLLPDGMLGLREAETHERLLLDNGPPQTLLSFEDGLPALTERSVGEGRCLLLATTLDTDFGDLPLRPGFMPLLAAMVREAAGVAAAARGHVLPGESVPVRVARGRGVVEVRAPDGTTQRFETTDSRYRATDQLGVYEIRSSQRKGVEMRLRGAFVVDPPKSESDLSPGPLPDVGKGERSGPGAVRVHRSLAPTLLLALFLLVVAEGMLRARRRPA